MDLLLSRVVIWNVFLKRTHPRRFLLPPWPIYKNCSRKTTVQRRDCVVTQTNVTDINSLLLSLCKSKLPSCQSYVCNVYILMITRCSCNYFFPHSRISLFADNCTEHLDNIFLLYISRGSWGNVLKMLVWLLSLVQQLETISSVIYRWLIIYMFRNVQNKLKKKNVLLFLHISSVL